MQAHEKRTDLALLEARVDDMNKDVAQLQSTIRDQHQTLMALKQVKPAEVCARKRRVVWGLGLIFATQTPASEYARGEQRERLGTERSRHEIIRNIFQVRNSDQ